MSVLLVGSLTVLVGKEVLNGSWAERYSYCESVIKLIMSERGYGCTESSVGWIAGEGVAALRLFARTARKRGGKYLPVG